jgi:hypothetical protein
MGESFGSSFTIVEVTSDGSEPKKQLWIALAKTAQAVSLVLALVPEGWTAEVVPAALNESQLRLFYQIKLKPGEVYKLEPE